MDSASPAWCRAGSAAHCRRRVRRRRCRVGARWCRVRPRPAGRSPAAAQAHCAQPAGTGVRRPRRLGPGSSRLRARRVRSRRIRSPRLGAGQHSPRQRNPRQRNPGSQRRTPQAPARRARHPQARPRPGSGRPAALKRSARGHGARRPADGPAASPQAAGQRQGGVRLRSAAGACRRRRARGMSSCITRASRSRPPGRSQPTSPPSPQPSPTLGALRTHRLARSWIRSR